MSPEICPKSFGTFEKQTPGLERGTSANLYAIVALPRCNEAPVVFCVLEGFFLREGTHPIHDDVTLYYLTMVCNYSSYVIKNY